jgi:uncharacterized protein
MATNSTPTLTRRLLRILVILLVTPPMIAAIAGWLVAPAYLHPIRRGLSADLIRGADATFHEIHATREDFNVHAPDGVLLRGWKVRSATPNGDWVLLFHGVADNRCGVLEHARVLLLGGYNVVMMDARAHGASEGPMATYGWLERNDTRAIVDALEASEHPRHLFALGESMGAGIALQSAAVEPRIEGVVAESAFANLTEAAYDYAGLRRYPWLGKSLLAPFAWVLIYRGEMLAGLPTARVSPEKAVASRAFPVLLICDADDDALPCRHTYRIYAAALGPKEMWVVPHAFHTAALGYQPVEFRRRVYSFYQSVAATPAAPPTDKRAAVLPYSARSVWLGSTAAARRAGK